MYADRLAKLHASPKQGVIVLAGGGASALAQLLGASGASGTLLEASVPYSAAALKDFLGQAPLSSVSAETARSMAAVAFQRANALDPTGRRAQFWAQHHGCADHEPSAPRRGPGLYRPALPTGELPAIH